MPESQGAIDAVIFILDSFLLMTSKPVTRILIPLVMALRAMNSKVVLLGNFSRSCRRQTDLISLLDRSTVTAFHSRRPLLTLIDGSEK